MRVSLKWLADYVSWELPPEELARRMTMAGVEVGTISRYGDAWQNVYVGQIVELTRHPNADRLLLATVDYGGQTLTVVTGAPNLRVGQKVPLALAGARLRDASAETPREVVLKPTKIRGIVSEGMVCSARELGLGEDHEGILILDPEARPGVPLRDELGDVVFDLEVTPNRSDCLSMLGVAREVAALTDGAVRVPAVDLEGGPNDVRDLVRIEIEDPRLCARYSATVIQGVQVRQSPKWLRDRLAAAGMRPINNVVDVTNYVMLEWGQPLHAFDYDTLRRRTIIVRRAGLHERLTTLDGVERDLTPEMLVIADAERPVALAGVMGGLDTEVTSETTTVLLESANFNPTSIRRTARALRLGSEASRRFERGMPAAHTAPAAWRATDLIRQLAGGTVARGVADNYPAPQPVVDILLARSEIRRLLGVDFAPAEVTRMLAGLGFSVRPEGDAFHVTVPPARLDVTSPADLCEELARIAGYDTLPTSLPSGEIPEPTPNEPWDWASALRSTLVGLGFDEVIAYTLTSRERLGRLLAVDATTAGAESFMAAAGRESLPADPLVATVAERFIPLHVEPVRLINPLSADGEVLRTTAFVSLLELLRDNLRHFDRDVHLFEIGRIYLPRPNDLPEERMVLTAVMGAFRSGRRLGARDENGFFDVKGVAEAVLVPLGLRELEYRPVRHPIFQPGRTAVVLRAGEGAEPERVIGVLGEVAEPVRAAFDVDQRAYLLGLDLQRLWGVATRHRTYWPLPRFPAVGQDVAAILDASITADEVAAVIRRAGQPLLKEIELFDVYQGDPVPAGKRSLAYHLVYQTPERTLTDREVAEVHRRIEQALIGELGAQLRA
ncbi:MAG: phenylalanine--tRNA ligase subunit beta [Chloroflexi bacterium]|nr:phenylalanine--tRNA ligase subunit beta [Chloroflexota bacterium]